MTTLLLERSPAFEEDFGHGARRRLDGAPVPGQVDSHGGLTLDDLITGVWEGLAVRATVNCPVCANPMTSRPAGGDAPTGASGACLTCGSRLS
jgi:hypothetical protein